MADHIEEIGIVIKADGTVELANGMKLSGDQVGRLATHLDKLSGSAATADKGLKQAGATARQTAGNMAAAGREIGQAGAALASGNWQSAARNLASAAVEARVLGPTMLAAGIAIGTVAAGVGAVALAAYQGMKAERELNDALVLTGNHAGVVTGQIDAMGSSIAKSIKGKVSDSREILASLVATGKFTQESIQEVGAAAQLLARFSGQSGEQVVKHFAGMAGGVAKGAAEMNEKYHFLTLAQWKHIEALEKAGKGQEAMRVLSEALSKHLGGDMTRNLGTLEKAVDSVARAWDGFWESVKGIGKEKSLDQLMAESTARLAQFQPPNRPISLQDVSSRRAASDLAAQQRDAESRAAESSINHGLWRRGEIGRRNVDEAGARQAAEDKAIAAAAAKAAKAAGGGGRAPDNIAERYMDQLKRQLRELSGETSTYADAVAYLALNKARFDKDQHQSVLLTAQEIDQKRQEIDLKRQKRDVDQAELRYLEQEGIARERAHDAWLDWQADQRQAARDREFEISLIGKTAEEVSKLTIRYQAEMTAKRALQGAISAHAEGHISDQELARRQRDIEDRKNTEIAQRNTLAAEQYKPGWEKMLQGWRDTNQLMADAYNTTMEGMLRNGEDAWVEFVRTGKFNARSLVDGVISEFARLEYRKFMAGSMGSGGGLQGLIQMIGRAFGMPSDRGFGTGPNFGSQDLGLFFHSGGVVGGAPTFSRPVNPAVFANAPRFHGGGLVAGEVPIIAQRGEGVFTREQMAALQPAGRSQPVVFAPVIHIDARTDRGEVEQLVTRAMKASQADLIEQMNRRQM